MYFNEESSNLEEQELKTITIRKVDAALYDKFVQLGKKFGKPMGVFFDLILRQVYYFSYPPFFIHGPSHIRKRRYSIETIQELTELHVCYRDLEQIKGKVIVNFVSINRLTFDENIDGKLLLDTVGIIKNCETVAFNGNVPDLIKYGLVPTRAKYSYPTDPSKLKDITIRNVRTSLYNLLLSESKKEAKTVGEYFSEKLASILPKIELSMISRNVTGPFPLIVLDREKLVVKKEDLQMLSHRKVIFYNIDQLKFDAQIPEELFLSTVAKIINCNSVTLPKTLPKLIMLARLENCNNIHFN